MFTIDSIPAKHKTEEEKVDYIKKEIKKVYNQYNKQAKTFTEIGIKLGQMFNTLKEVVKQDKEKWTEYLNDNFQFMNIRTAQRWMKVAENVNIDEDPNLAFAGQERLINLAKLAKKKKSEIPGFLKDNSVSTNFDPDNKKEVRKFRKEIDRLTEQESKAHPTTKEKTTGVLVKQILRTAKELTKKLEDDVEEGVMTSVDNETLEDSIDKLKDLLEQLQALRKQMKRAKGSERKRAA